MGKPLLGLPVCALGLLLFQSTSQAFTHVVQAGDTLAGIAERYYGRIQYEKFLVAENLLDLGAGSSIVPGMRLEVPALTHRLVRRGDSWESLATELLGAPFRADTLARANRAFHWVAPEEGAEIAVPYNLRVVVGGSESLSGIAYRFLGDANQDWVLDKYNLFKGKKLEPGDVVLVPLTDLPLTEAGKNAALESGGVICTQGGGALREAQRKVTEELPSLVAEVQSGHYLEALQRGHRFLASGRLTEPETARVYRQLLEAYVALDALELAASACEEWSKRGGQTSLNPAETSPKILTACGRTVR